MQERTLRTEMQQQISVKEDAVRTALAAEQQVAEQSHIDPA